jgi:hypothetical protein
MQRVPMTRPARSNGHGFVTRKDVTVPEFVIAGTGEANAKAIGDLIETLLSPRTSAVD